MHAAASFDPIKHPRRLALLRDKHLAQRTAALAPALCSSEVAERLGISRAEVEQLAARHGFAFYHHDER
ncbi:hypothetical protein D9M68_159000 [compost metagenome]